MSGDADGGPVDVEELPDHPIDREVYTRLRKVVSPERSQAGTHDDGWYPPDTVPNPVSVFRFRVEGEWYVYGYCSGCGTWEAFGKKESTEGPDA